MLVRRRARDAGGNEVELTDALVDNVTTVLFAEVKAKWVREDVVLNEDPETYIEHLREKYGCSDRDGSSPTGVSQLARTIDKLASGERRPVDRDLSAAERILPILLVHDSLLEAPAHGRFLAAEFSTLLRPDDAPAIGDMRKGRFRVAPLIVMTLDDLENLETSTENFALLDVLVAYSAECPDRAESFRDFLARSLFAEKLVYSKTLARQGIDALNAALEILGAEEPCPSNG